MVTKFRHTGIKGRQFPYIIISPGVAKVMAREGLSKRDVQQYLFDHPKVAVPTLYRHAWEPGYTEYDLHKLYVDGMISSAYVGSRDPER